MILRGVQGFLDGIFEQGNRGRSLARCMGARTKECGRCSTKGATETACQSTSNKSRQVTASSWDSGTVSTGIMIHGHVSSSGLRIRCVPLPARTLSSKLQTSSPMGYGKAKGRFNPASRHRARSPVTPGIAISNASGYHNARGRNELSISCLPTEEYRTQRHRRPK